MQALLAFTRSGTFAGRAARMGGYDVVENRAVAFDFYRAGLGEVG
jgi:hypothetical protein